MIPAMTTSFRRETTTTMLFRRHVCYRHLRILRLLISRLVFVDYYVVVPRPSPFVSRCRSTTRVPVPTFYRSFLDCYDYYRCCCCSREMIAIVVAIDWDRDVASMLMLWVIIFV